MDEMPGISIETTERVQDIPADDWARLAPDGHPFLSYAFLCALEQSGCATADTGWLGRHYLARAQTKNEDGYLIGLMPNYVKGHSQGEYVFDHNWAHAFETAGGRYYPKLLSAIPFTPAGAPKLLAANEQTKRALVMAQQEDARNLGLSSAHAIFLNDENIHLFKACGYLERRDVQYHWCNQDYDTFDAFLDALASRKRKAIRRERKKALENDLAIEWVSGAQINEAHWDAFYEFYMDTGMRKWGRPYLNREFFSLIGESMANQILLILARRGERYIAGALNFIGTDTLYGRYWGAVEHHPFLHFEVCYYQAIDFAIERGLKCVEAGAQGEHKVARGYEPVKTRSAHWFPDPRLHDAVARYLEDETSTIDDYAQDIQGAAPFRKT